MKRRYGVFRILVLLLKVLNAIRLVGVIVDWFVDWVEQI